MICGFRVLCVYVFAAVMEDTGKKELIEQFEELEDALRQLSTISSTITASLPHGKCAHM